MDKYEREKILEGIHTFIGLSFPEFYEDTRKTLPAPPSGSGRGRGRENLMKHVQSLFHSKVLLFREKDFARVQF